MSPEKDSLVWRFKWHTLIILAALVIVGLLTIFTDVFQSSETNMVRQMVFMLGALVFLAALLTMLSRVFKILDAMKDNSAKLEQATGVLEKISAGLATLNHSTRISEVAKSIAFRDADKQSLRQAVFMKLQQRDFDGAFDIINEIAQRAEYKDLADELRVQGDRFHDATDQERINQGIAAIDKLLDESQWVRASAQIEALIKSYPDCEPAKAMRQELVEKKDQRKRILLAAWDDAIKQQETDRSLEILKDLDSYLTANEGLALQEAAKDVFRTKLHNLGVQFSMAVAEKRWTAALEVGEQIVVDFPNSRMAEEIRTKLEVLKRNVQMQTN